MNPFIPIVLRPKAHDGRLDGIHRRLVVAGDGPQPELEHFNEELMHGVALETAIARLIEGRRESGDRATVHGNDTRRVPGAFNHDALESRGLNLLCRYLSPQEIAQA